MCSYTACNIDACLPAHSDAIWASQWTSRDTVVTASADGTIRQWDAQSGEQLHARPPYPLGIISLSVSAAGDRAVYNSLEGLTQLMDLTDGSLLASHESYARDPAATQQSEPGGFSSNLCGQAIDNIVFSLGCFHASQRRDVCISRC